MAASFPASAKAFTTKSDGAGNTILAAHVNDVQLEITAIESCLLGGTAFSPTILGTLTVTGAATISTTLAVTGATTLASTLGVTGALTFQATVASTTTSGGGAAITATEYRAFANATHGACLAGFGTTNDVALFNKSVAVVLRVPTGTTNVSVVGTVAVADATATPAGGSTGVRLVFGTTAGFGVYVGSGAPTVSAAQGSLYLRSDGSTTTTRAYINTDGVTTWTAITTVA